MTLNATGWFPNRHAASGLVLSTALLFAAAGVAADGQVIKAPRYQSPVDAPAQQLNLPPLPPAITPHGTVVEDIVVRVNDQIISRSDVERQQRQLDESIAQGTVPRDQLATEQKNLLRDMIDQQLLLSRGKELGLNADNEVIRQLDDIRKKNNFASMDELERAVRKEGINFEDFKAKIRNQFLTQMVVRDEVGRRLQLSQGEATRYYDAHKQDFLQPEQIRLSEILIPTPESATPEQITQAQAKAVDVRAQLARGGDFGDLAKKFSGGPTAAQGGDLGLFKRGALAKVLEDQTFALKVGDATDPTRTRQGFVILKVTQHDQAGPSPMKDVMPQIEEAMYMQQMQPALRAYLTKLREDSYVDIQPGFVDSGASASETKPVFTAYAPPVPKKKVEKQKGRFDRNGTATAKAVIASPDTTGSRTLTGADAARPAAVDPNTGLAAISMPAKPGANPARHLRREKVRFGQAPRNSLGSGAGPDTASADVQAPGAGLAPGAVMASNGTAPGTVDSANLEDNPLTPHAPERSKTRFAAKEKEVQAIKAQTVTAKQQEKILARPAPDTAEEKATARTQAAPLGLGGDTARKPAKPKRSKGTPKERLQEKSTESKPVPVAPDQTVNPALAPVSVPPSASTTAPAPTTPPQR